MKKTTIDDFLKKGNLPSKQLVLMRKDLADKLKYIAGLSPTNKKIHTADLLNNIIEHFFDTYKEEIGAFVAKCQQEGSEILNK